LAARVYTAPLLVEAGIDHDFEVLAPPGFRMVVRNIQMYTSNESFIWDFQDLLTNALVWRIHREGFPIGATPITYQWTGWWVPNENEPPFIGFKMHSHDTYGSGYDVSVTGHLLTLP
jgi:hypothetical protein